MAENFISKADYYHRIQEKKLNMILENEDNYLENAELTAKSTITDALHSRYDVEDIFSKTGDDRNKTIMRWMINLVLYYLYERIPDKLVPDRVVKNYDDTMHYLLEIADGKKSMDLPRLEDEDGNEKTKFRWGSVERRTHN